MLTDLTWISEGKPWPPEDADEAARLAEHARMRAIYNGLHESVFPRYIAYLTDQSKDTKKQAVILDWPELATSSYLNLLVGEEPKVDAGKRADLPDRPDEEVFLDASRYGIGLYEITGDGLYCQSPENCYLVTAPGRFRWVTEYVFFFMFAVEKIEYIKLTIHGKGYIQHILHILKDGKLGPRQDLAAFPTYFGLEVDADGKQITGADDILVVRVDNILSSERYYGRSDYKQSITSLLESLEMLFAQRAEVVSKFTNPTPIIPESATTFDHSTQEWVYKPGQPIIMEPGSASPSLMVWDAQLGQVDRAIEQSMDQLLQMLQLSRVLLAGQGQGQAESGTALRIRLIPTLAKVSKMARAAEKAIPKVLNLWSQLHPPEIPLEKITVNLQDGIPEDPLEIAQTIQLWDAMGAVSLERKLELQGLKEGSDAFNTEFERLKAAQPKAPEAPVVELPGLEAPNE